MNDKGKEMLYSVVDECTLKVKLIERDLITFFSIDVNKREFQKGILGKKVGEKFSVPNTSLTYEILEIFPPKSYAVLKKLEEFEFEGFHHYTNFENFENIMRSGKLYSRNNVKTLFPMFHDSASRSVISNTIERVQDKVRFYYKEKTPTFYINEGIKLDSNETDSDKETAHMPIPVLLLFSKKLINYDDVCFSDGNCGSHYTGITSNFETAAQYDWEGIFSRGPMSDEQKIGLIRKRNAEFLVPNEIDLKDLIAIVFRSQADKKHAEITIGKNSLYKVDPSKFFACYDSNRNYLCDYSDIDENQQVVLTFQHNPSEYIHKLIVYYKDGSMKKQILSQKLFNSRIVKLKLSLSLEKVKRIEYIMSGTGVFECNDVSAIWEN